MSKLDPEFPTFSNNRSATSPDFITGNRYVNLNIYSKPGRISSNHLPVIAIISINPIRIPFQPRFHCRKVDWKTFKNRFQNSNILDVNGKTTGHIANESDSWYKDITSAKMAEYKQIQEEALGRYSEIRIASNSTKEPARLWKKT